MPQEQENVSQEKVEAYAEKLLGYKTGEQVSLMVHIGDRLGLYEILQDAGAVTAEEMAAHTGLQERWLLEWLRGQSAAGLLTFQDDERFRLSPAGAVVLTDSQNPHYMAGFFSEPPPPEVLDRLTEAFSTGIGMSWDDHGPKAARMVERATGPVHRSLPVVLEKVEGLTARLESGSRVLDVGCGVGLALGVLARIYPKSEFTGYDPSPIAISRARERADEEKLPNVTFEVAAGEDLPAEPLYDLILVLDCMHDMPYPRQALKAIRGAVNTDGILLIKDVRCSDKFQENIENPLAPMLYGFSVVYCMSSALSKPGGAGMGTMGFNPEIATALCLEAGFSRFQQIDFHEDPLNNFYEVRP